MRRLKTKLLFALASEHDFLRKSEGFGYKNYGFLYRRLAEFERGSVRDGAARLSREGMIDKIERNNQVWFRLTGVGREKLLKQIALYKGQKKVWDRIWRLVILNGAGEDLRALQRELSQLGYRRVSRGVYVTPLAVSEKTKQLFLEKKWLNKAQVIESRKLIVGDDLQLARRLWQLDQTASRYEDFVRVADRLLKLGRRNIILLRQSKGGFKEVFDRYFSLMMTDPGLPKKLLPPDWQAEKAQELFFRLVELAKTAKA